MTTPMTVAIMLGFAYGSCRTRPQPPYLVLVPAIAPDEIYYSPNVSFSSDGDN